MIGDETFMRLAKHLGRPSREAMLQLKLDQLRLRAEGRHKSMHLIALERGLFSEELADAFRVAARAQRRLPGLGV